VAEPPNYRNNYARGMAPSVRPAELGDAAAWASIVAACSPYLVQDARSTEHELRTEPPQVRRLVATRDGRVVGVSRLHAYLDEEHATLLVMVPAEHRRAGVGRTLLAAQLPSVRAAGKDTVASVVEDDADSRAAAAAWGFVSTRSFAMSMVEPGRVVASEIPEGVEVVPLTAVPTRVVWHAHSAVVREDPSGLSVPVTFEEFLDDWGDPRMRPDLGRAVLVDGEFASFTMLGVAGDRAWSDMTGTLPAYRGRGYALLAKQHSLVAAAAAGVTKAIAGNDERNGPMVAVNRALGYRPFAHPELAELSLPPA
jgi:GNAT superfamily N-acetyltransferase